MDALSRRRIQTTYYEGLPFVDFSKVWTCPWHDLSDYPITPLSLVSDDIWVIPEAWCAPDARMPFERTIDFSKAVPPEYSSDAASSLLRRIKRLAILDRSQTLRTGSRTMPPVTPTTWVKKYQQLIRAVRFSLQHLKPHQALSSCPDGPTIFRSLSPEQMEQLKVASPSWANSSIARLNALFKAQLFDDWPAPDVAAYKPKRRQGSRSSEGFNDRAFTEILKVALWLNDIQPEVLAAYLSTRDIKKTEQGSWRLSLVIKYRREMVRSWSSEKLKEGTIFPFWIDLPGEGKKLRRFDAWPLDTVRSLKALLHKCQTANAIMILGSTGMRIGELASLDKKSLVSRDGRYFLRARSFKDSDMFAGETRQWPLPDVATRAFKAQVELVSTLSSGDNLWYPFNEGRNKRGLPSFLAVLKNFGQAIGM